VKFDGRSRIEQGRAPLARPRGDQQVASQ